MNKPKSIGIDCRMSSESGIGRYITNIVRNLTENDLTNSYTLYTFTENDLSELHLPENFNVVLAPFRWHTFSEQFNFLFLILKGNHDLFHFPQTNYPIFYYRKFLITIHDLTMVKHMTGRASTLFYPIYFLKLLFFKLILKTGITFSEKIITVSEFVKKELVSDYKVSNIKIKCIYNGVDLKLNFNPEKMEYFRDKYQINKPFLFYVGNAYPHKNLEKLILAFSLFNSENKYELVLAGKMDFFYERLVKEYKKLENIKFVFNLNDEELSKFYSSCELFVYPSVSEGFGIQIVEALALKAKVCCSDNSTFPEIAGKLATYFNPYKIEEMVSSIKESLESSKKISEAEIKELKQKFNWKKSAQLHQELYEES